MPVSEYDEDRDLELDRAQKKYVLSRLFPEPVSCDADKDNLGLLGNF